MKELPINFNGLLWWMGLLGGLVWVLLFVVRSEKMLQKPMKINLLFFGRKANQEYGVRLLNRLFRLMNDEKPYLEKNISLESLAARLNVTAAQLTQVIDENLEQGFPELISTYRIQEAKRLLVMPEYQQSKMEDLAYKVGYESIALFDDAFKNFTEQTPTEYKKRMSMICL